MNKQSITPEQFRAVAGTMPACRAADALGISQANFYRLAQIYSISTAFVYKPWKPEEKQIAAEMRAAGDSRSKRSLESLSTEILLKNVVCVGRNVRAGHSSGRSC